MGEEEEEEFKKYGGRVPKKGPDSSSAKKSKKAYIINMDNISGDTSRQNMMRYISEYETKIIGKNLKVGFGNTKGSIILGKI